MPKLPAIFLRKKIMTEIKNAVISEVFIGLNDKEILTAWVIVNFGMAKQGFGGLDFSVDKNAVTFLASVMAVVGVSCVADLTGKAVRVEHDLKKIYAIGNYVENKWYNIDTGVVTIIKPPQGSVDAIVEKYMTTNTPETGTEITIDADGKKHYNGKADAGKMGAKLG